MSTPLLHWSGKRIPENFGLLISQALRPFVSKGLVECRFVSMTVMVVDRVASSELEIRLIRKNAGTDGLCTTGSFLEQQGLVLALALIAIAKVLPIEIAMESGDVIEDKSLRQAPKELLVSPLFTQDKIDALLEEVGLLLNFRTAVSKEAVSLIF